METVGYILASATPLILPAVRAMALRGWMPARQLLLDLALLLAGIPIGIALIGRTLSFPHNAGDHSPGIGIALMPLMMAAAFGLLIWLARLALYLLRRQAGA
jgi:hypothetical protein